jgi:hypothetical protein
MDVSGIIWGVIFCAAAAWSAWFFVVSWFVPPRECPQLVALTTAWRADRRAELYEEIRLTTSAADDELRAARTMANTGELDRLNEEVARRHARHLREHAALIARLHELYEQLQNCG